MSYNLVENSNFYTTTSGVGNVSLKVSEVVSIADLSGTTTLSGSDILQLEVDFGARVKIDEARYYFSSTSSSGTVASGIKFYYKDDEPDSYSLLTTNIDTDYYYTTVPGLSAPRYLRVVHTISGTAISGTVTGLSVLNEDDTVDFGSDGTATSFAATTSILGGSAEVRTIPIYNDGSFKATAYVILEPQGTNVDELATLSTTSGGPWYGVKENSQLLADVDSWDEDGELSNTEINGLGLLCLTASGTEGTYTTKVFDIDSKNSFIYLDIYSEPEDSFITKDADKNLRTIEIRSSGQRPNDYALCRTFNYTTISGYRWLYYTDSHRDDGGTIYTSGYLSNGSHTSYDYYVRCAEADYESGNTAGFVYRTKNGSNWRQLRVFSISETGSYSDYIIVQRDSSTEISNDCYDIRWDTDGGVWFSLYTDYSRGGYTLNQGTGYYLIRFTSGFSGTSCKLYSSSSKQAWDMSCVYSSGKLWYTDRNVGFVKLMDTTGTEEVQYSDSSQLYGISATSNGGCWYVSGTSLKKLSSTGTLLATLEDVGSTSLRRVLVDGDDFLYIIDGNYVKRLSTDGTVQFSTYVDQADKLLQVTDTGVWVRTSDSHVRFVDSTGELKPTNISYNYLPAVIEYSYDSEGHGFHTPVSTDTHWQNLEWREVRPDKYPVPIGDEYAQARITLRSSTPIWNSPQLQNIYLQKSIEIPNIYPNTAKNAYLKLNVPTQDMSWAGSYGTNLKAWWEVPT